MKIKQHYIYSNSDLPKFGWLQACLCCREFTSREILFKVVKDQLVSDIIHEFYIHICPRCKKKTTNIYEYIKFSKLANKTIKRKFYDLIPG
jgi:hypothetical protein